MSISLSTETIIPNHLPSCDALHITRDNQFNRTNKIISLYVLGYKPDKKGLRTTCLIDSEYLHIRLDYSYKNFVHSYIQTERYYIYRLALFQMLYILLEGLQMAQIGDFRQILQFFASNF